MGEICVSGGTVGGARMQEQRDNARRTRDECAHKIAVAVITGSTLAMAGAACVAVGGGSFAITTASGALTMIGCVSGGAGLVILAAAANILLGQMRASK